MKEQEELCDVEVHINGHHSFFMHQRALCVFSGRVRKMVKEEKAKGGRGAALKIMDFPGGADGFELAARFCYNGGRIPMSPTNICLLHSAAAALEMTEEYSPCNLLGQAETFLDGLFYWTWSDILAALKSLEPFFYATEESGLLQRLVSSLLAKISANSEIPLSAMTPPIPSSSSSSSSPSPEALGFRFSSSSITRTPDAARPCFVREWWFDDLTILHPKIIEKIMQTLGAYGDENKNLILTRFLLHYLKSAAQRPRGDGGGRAVEYGGLADTAVHGVVLMGRTVFSCRGLFWVLRVVSGLGLSRDCRQKLERLMGSMLDQATLDDLLVSGHDGAVYDVNLVMSLVKVFVDGEDGDASPPSHRTRKVARLLDKYLREVSPDQCLKVSKFVGLAESLPDSARECFDGVYRAIDIYLEAHPTLSAEDKSRLCRCLNYEKLSIEACRDLAKNPRIPPRAAVRALLVSQQPPKCAGSPFRTVESPRSTVYFKGAENLPPPSPSPSSYSEEKEELRVNLQRMQRRVVELENVCKEMKGQMTKMARRKAVVGGSSPAAAHHHHHQMGRGLPRLC